MGAARLLVGGLVLLAALPLLGGRPSRALALWRSPLGLTAGVGTALYQVCFFAAVQQAGVALGTLVTIGASPVFAGLLALAALKEPLHRSWMAATVLCVAGLVLLSRDGARPPGDGGGAGILLALGAGLAYAGYTVATKGLLERGESSATAVTAAASLGGILLAPMLLTQPSAWLASPAGVALAAYLGVVTLGLAYTLYGRGLALLPAGPVTTLVLAEPLVATLLGVTLLGERLPALASAGALVVLVGLVLQGAAASRRPASR